MRPSQANLALDTLRNSFSTPLRRKGVMLSHDDSQTVMEVYQQWLLLLLDLDYLHPETLMRDSRRLLTDMVGVDVYELNSAFAECLQLVRLQTNKGFKALCSIVSPHLYRILRDDLQMMINGDVRAAKRLMQALAYTSRLSLADIDMTQQMVEEYAAIEESIPDELPLRLVYRLQNIIKRWMEPFDPARIVPRHGRRGVAFAGRASYETKYRLLSSDQMLRYAFGEDWWSCDLGADNLQRISEMKFVPKSYKTLRTICMEPVTLMYFQQGVWREIDRVVCGNWYLKNHIGFHDQSRNIRLAKEGSIMRNYATIDLSSASDSVSYKLVKEVFSGTKLLRYLMATRTRKTLTPTGVEIPLRKFASMGSALCFPVETIIFAAICELVTRELRVSGDYSVYGDDIIVPTQCAGRTMDVLQRLGFRVNREKSFHHEDCWFRESCGGEFCDGYDVTPLRVTRKYTHRERDVRLEALIDSANLAYARGFKNLRGFFLRKIREFNWVPLFAPTSIVADNYTNYHARWRWCRDYQCIQVRVSSTQPRYTQDDLDGQDESLRYRHWLEQTYNRDSVDADFESIICKSTKCNRNIWRSKPYEPSDQRFIDARLDRYKLPGTDNSNR